MTKKKYISFLFGFLPSLVFPLFFLILFIKFNFDGSLKLGELLFRLKELRLMSGLIAVCAVPNLLLLYFFLSREKWIASRGVLFATLLFLALVILYKFLL